MQILDPAFARYRIYSSTLEQVASGLRWAEGPVYFPEGGYLLVSDIPNNRIMKYSEKDGSFSVFRSPANYANGNTRDRQRPARHLRALGHPAHHPDREGRQGHGPGRRLRGQAAERAERHRRRSRTTASGSPTRCFGINGEWEGSRAKPEQATTNVYRIGSDGKVSAVLTDLVNPNGLAFSPDEKKLYVVEWKGTPNRSIWSYDVGARRHRAGQQDQADRRRRPGRARRLPGRPRRQPLVRLGQQRGALQAEPSDVGEAQGLPASRPLRGPATG